MMVFLVFLIVLIIQYVSNISYSDIYIFIFIYLCICYFYRFEIRVLSRVCTEFTIFRDVNFDVGNQKYTIILQLIKVIPLN